MIYFIRPRGSVGPVKIGLADDVQKRLKGLCASSPVWLELAAQIDGGLDIEARFHERFLPQHSHYEWFHWSADLQQAIDEINAGTFDVATLPDARGNAPTQRGKKNFWRPERRKWLLEAQVISRLSVSPECATEATTAGTQLVASPFPMET